MEVVTVNMTTFVLELPLLPTFHFKCTTLQHYKQSIHHNTVLDRHFGRFSFNNEEKYHSFKCH